MTKPDVRVGLLGCLIQLLQNDSELWGILQTPASVYNVVPKDTDYPYVRVAFISPSENWDTDTDLGLVVYFQITIWDNEESTKRIMLAQKRIYTLLHNNEDVLGEVLGHNVVSTFMVFEDVIDNGDKFQGVQQFKAVTEEI